MREERQLERLPTAGNQLPVTGSGEEKESGEDLVCGRKKEASAAPRRREETQEGKGTVATGSRAEGGGGSHVDGWIPSSALELAITDKLSPPPPTSNIQHC
ncbi:hypothetical protein EYF80_061933 [Liparis tanakae]|uniref:Uncharacterized protein n=1 Tax=Liparis tanakae TaxID=230148 RepID=A0A4Z2EGA0_9TELE|nr:hypothetical protein EYF80_061933 [Liparis tanakae]